MNASQKKKAGCSGCPHYNGQADRLGSCGAIDARPIHLLTSCPKTWPNYAPERFARTEKAQRLRSGRFHHMYGSIARRHQA